jgi:hypothetical protein
MYMKPILISLLIACTISASAQQDFEKRMAEARTAFAANKLDDARFAMQQMMQELDILTGKDVLKLLPEKMDQKAANTSKDNVSGASGWAGVVVHREYGLPADTSLYTLEVITNSPLLAMVNQILNMPLLAGSNPDQKVIRVGGYKALSNRSSGANGRDEYEIQVPLQSSMITFKAPGMTQDKVIEMANTIKVAEIAKLVQ